MRFPLSTISGRTKVAAVVGYPIAHSGSPKIHNAAFTACGLDWVYAAFPCNVGSASQVVAAMRTLGLAGLSVTMPLKTEIAGYVDALTPAAQALESCNCLYWDNGQIIGDSTDGVGFVRAFEFETGVSLKEKKVAVLGAGGAARSIVEALGAAEASEILVVNRTAQKAKSAAHLARQARVGSYEEVAAADVVINTTSLGMEGGPDPKSSPLPAQYLRSNQIVYDIVYQPRQTVLLKAAKNVGASTYGGLSMLVHQAAAAFELWTGEKAPIKAMNDAVC